MKLHLIAPILFLISSAANAVEKMNYGNTQTFRIEEGVEKIDSKYWTLNKKEGVEYYSSALTLGFGLETNNEVRSIIEKDKSGLVQVVTTQQSVIRFDIHAAPGSKEEIRISDYITRVDLPSHASTTCDEVGCVVVTPKFCHAMGRSMHGGGHKTGKMKKDSEMMDHGPMPMPEMKEMKKLFGANVELRKKQIEHIESLKKSGVITASKFETIDLLSKKDGMGMRHGHRIMKACEEIPATLVRAEK